MELSQFKTVEQLAAAIKSLDMVTSVPWTPHQDDSTIVGWTSYTYKLIYYKKVGKTVYVQYFISGESDHANVTFTLPFTQQANVLKNSWARTQDDGGAWQSGFANLPADSKIVRVYPDVAGTGFTTSGDKGVSGSFKYEAA